MIWKNALRAYFLEKWALEPGSQTLRTRILWPSEPEIRDSGLYDDQQTTLVVSFVNLTPSRALSLPASRSSVRENWMLHVNIEVDEAAQGKLDGYLERLTKLYQFQTLPIEPRLIFDGVQIDAAFDTEDDDRIVKPWQCSFTFTRSL